MDAMEEPKRWITAGKSLDAQGRPCLYLKIQEERFEVNVRLREEEMPLFASVANADWNKRQSVRIGTCAGNPVFWCSTDAALSILIGHDDETWDFAVFLPVPALQEITACLAAAKR